MQVGPVKMASPLEVFNLQICPRRLNIEWYKQYGLLLDYFIIMANIFLFEVRVVSKEQRMQKQKLAKHKKL